MPWAVAACLKQVGRNFPLVVHNCNCIHVNVVLSYSEVAGKCQPCCVIVSFRALRISGDLADKIKPWSLKTPYNLYVHVCTHLNHLLDVTCTHIQCTCTTKANKLAGVKAQTCVNYTCMWILFPVSRGMLTPICLTTLRDDPWPY